MSCTSKSFYVGGIKTDLAWATIAGRRTRVVPGQAATGPVAEYDFPEVSVHELIEQGWTGELELPNSSGHGDLLKLPFNPAAAYGHAGRAGLAATLAANPQAVEYVNIRSLKDEDQAGYTQKVAHAVMEIAAAQGLPPGSAAQHQMYDLAESCPVTMAKLLKSQLDVDFHVTGDGINRGEVIAQMTYELASSGEMRARAHGGGVIQSFINDPRGSKFLRICTPALAELTQRDITVATGVVNSYLHRGLQTGDDLPFAAQVARSADQCVPPGEAAYSYRDWAPKLLAMSMGTHSGPYRDAMAGAATAVMGKVMAAGAGPSLEQLASLYEGSAA